MGTGWTRATSLFTVIAAVLLLMAQWDAATLRGDVGYLRLRQPPEGWSGTIPLAEVIEIQPPSAYVLRKSSVRIEVLGPTAGLEVGQEWSVRGTFRGGRLVQAWRAPAPDRPAKKRLGILGLAITGAVLVVSVRPVSGGLALRG